MADNNDPGYETEGLSEETARMAALGRGEDPAAGSEEETGNGGSKAGDEGGDKDSQEETNETPEWVPEKFLKDGQPDYEAMAKAYSELEKKLGKSKDDASEEDDTKDEKGDDEKGEDDEVDPERLQAEWQENLQTKVTSAQQEYAENGELSEDTYEALTDLLGKQYVDNYLAGVSALEAKLNTQVYELAGSQEDYEAAVKWAREGWSESKISKFDAAIGDEDLMPSMIRDLMASYREANPGEGSPTERGPGVHSGDVYTDPEEFLRDLAKADEEKDGLARRKAVQKLQRSKKAGTIQDITPRTGLSQFG